MGVNAYRFYTILIPYGSIGQVLCFYIENQFKLGRLVLKIQRLFKIGISKQGLKQIQMIV